MVNTLLETCERLVTLPSHISRDRGLKIKQYKLDIEKQNLFKGVFKNTGQAVIDDADGVARCSNCHWEVHGNICPNCHIRLRNYIDEISSSDTDLGLDYLNSEHISSRRDWENASLSEDGEFRMDSMDEDDEDFIDDGSLVEDAEQDNLSLSGSAASRDSSPVRQPGRRYIPTFVSSDEPWEDDLSDHVEHYETWDGFEDEVDREVHADIDSEGENEHGSEPSMLSLISILELD